MSVTRCAQWLRRTVPLLLLALLLTATPSALQAAATAPHACTDGLQDSGATYRICMPESWNGWLVVYAHGYVAPNRPVGIPEDQMRLPGSPASVDQLVTAQGYAFVTSGYRVNGLAVQEGIADLVDAVSIFTAQQGVPQKVLLVGISEGGAIATLALERHPDRFDGGLAMCGPYGSFRDQINYFGDFRAVFDYLFPTVMPPTGIEIPPTLLDEWETSYYSTTVQPVITATANLSQVNTLLAVTAAPFDTADASTKTKTIKDLLWYNVFATNDATAKLGGQPFDNLTRLYSGSGDDAGLNAGIARYGAAESALTALTAYETSGQLIRPLVTLHTIGDPIVPAWQATRYAAKVAAAGRTAFLESMTLDNYGHCQFSTIGVLTAFNRVVALVNDPPQLAVYLPLIANE